MARPQPTASATFSQPALHENSHVRSRSLPGPVDDVEDDGGESHLERTNRPESRLHLIEEERFVDDTVRGSDTSADAERPVDRPVIVRVYDEIVHWRKKFFTVPCNSVGKAFVTELAAQLDNFVDSGGKDESALFNFATLPTLLLQKPTRENCSHKVATDHLRRRLDLWRDRNLESLLDEGRCLQMHVHGGHKPGGRLKGQKDHAREFGLSMASGQVHQALRTLAEQTTPELASGVLQAGETITLADGRSATVKDLLTEKHPQAERATSNILINGDPTNVNPIRFEALTPKLIERVAVQCKGSAGPSGLDADAWRRLCVSLKGPSTKMCQSLASLARLLATKEVSPSAVGPLMACRLIALDKNPGVRPIGVCEVARRICVIVCVIFCCSLSIKSSSSSSSWRMRSSTFECSTRMHLPISPEPSRQHVSTTSASNSWSMKREL